MTRATIKCSSCRIIVRVFRIGRPERILDYFFNLGAVSKVSFIEEESDHFNYLAKNRQQLVRKNEELLKKIKQLEG